MKKPGKQFEEDFKNSIPKDSYYIKLPDAAVGFDIENSTQRFSQRSKFDYLIIRNARTFCLELKSTKNKIISYGPSGMIKDFQVNELRKAAKSGAEAGFILNFRDTGNTYYLWIGNFDRITESSCKKSINENDIKECALIVPARKLKVNYRYDLSVLLGGD